MQKTQIKIYKNNLYHCYFQVIKEGQDKRYFSVEGTPKQIKRILDTYFKVYPKPEEGCWSRLMTMRDFIEDRTNNEKTLCNIQFNTEMLNEEYLF